MKIDDALNNNLIEMAKVKSTTDPDIEYTIHRERNAEEYSCTCTGYTTSRKRPKMCKHLKEYLFRREVEIALTEFEYRGFWQPTSEGCYENIVNKIVRIAKERGLL